MEKKFAHTFDHKIWNIRADEQFLVLELRDEIKRKVYLASIDLSNGALLWCLASPIQTWWQSLAEVVDDTIQLVEFSSEQQPRILNNYYLSAKNGTLIESNVGNVTHKKTNATIIQPIHYTEESRFFPAIFKFFYRLFNIDIQKAVDYLEFKDKIIISYYLYNNNSFSNYLLITNKQQDVLLNELIANSEGLGMTTFVVKPDILLYVKHKYQIHGYEI